MTDPSQNDDRVSIGRIPLKQVRVNRPEPAQAAASANPMNKLVPYLDLFVRLADEELSRLADVEVTVVAALRKQVIAIDEALAHYADLLPRLADEELMRLTGATAKTIRFWRLCQPRFAHPTTRGAESSSDGVVARAASAKATTGPMPAAEGGGAGPSPSAGEAPGAATAKSRKPPRGRAASPKQPESATPRPKARPGTTAQPAAAAASGQPARPRGDELAKIPAAAQAVVSEMMEFSGAPFPGYDDGVGAPEPPPEGISLAEIEEDEPFTG